ncbi:carotenoid oxygenase family protein [Okeania sp. SIO2B3]|uniref:carotenoid oxygenase family protein n=1 Tax=Okeania sp. SIO2B3 TaxID=2607784 RepID=UPI0025F0FC44|nr:carotenoid oxygenase family protein [Okeania sp. SIO2B3]
MIVKNRSFKTPAWAKAFTQPAQEFPPTTLPIISGVVPSGLRGCLYRNGPARLSRNQQQVGHWFDGDGAILAVHFNSSFLENQEPWATYRYVQTAGYQLETEKEKFIFGGYGMNPPGNLWDKLTQPIKNAANTSVLALPDRLLALWEGGHPHTLNLETLATLGLEDLGGLENHQSYSAHPKIDSATGDIYNFGVTPGLNSSLNIYRSDSTGKIQQKGLIPISGVPLIHDFVLAGPYLIFFISPVRLKLLPAFTKIKSFSDALTWQPELGTQILLVDRSSLQLISRQETEPWFQWHFGNSYVDSDGTILVYLIRYADFNQTNKYLQEVPTGQTHTPAHGIFWQIRLDPKSGSIIESDKLLDIPCEFPTVAPAEVGKPSRFSYLAVHKPGIDISQEMFGAIACFDHHKNTLTTTNLRPNCYPMEPIYAPDAEDDQKGWVLTVIFDGEHNCSEVWIFDSSKLDAEPVCRLALPEVIPMGFHGTWSHFS